MKWSHAFSTISELAEVDDS